MNNLWSLLAVMPAALAMCFVLTGVHGYLGLHVLRRKVIFVDLALAQIAALGGITAMALGFDPEHGEEGVRHTLRIFQALGWDLPAPSDSTMVYAFSLVFALFGAAVFAFTRMRDERVPQEAFIGVTFATAIALALLLLVRVGGGAEQIRNMLARDALLFSTWTDVAKTGALYGSIALFHLVFYKRFFAISENHEEELRAGTNLRLWDFLFYASFALVITESVQIAGVLLVFSYLVVPGAVGVLFATRVRSQVLLAWGTGFGVSAAGLLICAVDNLEPPGSSPGPWIVAGLASVLLAVGLVRALRHSERPLRFLLRMGLGLAALIALVLMGPLLSKVELHEGSSAAESDPILALLKGSQEEQLRAIHELELNPAPQYAEAMAELLLGDPQAQVTEAAIEQCRKLGGTRSTEALFHTASRPLDPTLRAAAAMALLSLHDPRALTLLFELLQSAALPPFDESDVAESLAAATGQPLDAEDSESVASLGRWLESSRAALRFDAAADRFVAGAPKPNAKTDADPTIAPAANATNGEEP